MTEDNDLARYFAANCARWDESVAIHAASRGYDLDGFLRREKTLYSIEMDEVGNVAGKTLLHLQCHLGMDTLNWARLGASAGCYHRGRDAPAIHSRGTGGSLALPCLGLLWCCRDVHDGNTM